MRIVSVSTLYPGPGTPYGGLFVQRRLAPLAGLADVRVVHVRPWFPFLRRCPAAYLQRVPGEHPPAERVPMFYLPGVFKALDGYWLKRAVLPALRALDAERPLDAIEAQFGYPEGVGCVLAGQTLGRPVFLTLHGLEAWVLQQRGRGPRLAEALRQCAGVVCVSHSLRKVVLDQGVEPEKVRVIHNAAGRDVFHPMPREEARKRLDLEASGRLLVSVARFDYEKGQHVLLGAFRRLRDRMPDLRLALIGERAIHEPKYLDRIAAMVRELGLAERVLMVGPQPPERVALWLNAADLFVLATYHEACCCAVLEATACGLPVVTTPVGDNALLVGPPRRGLLVPVEDEAALADGIDKALTMAWDRDAIARHGAAHGWEEVARQVLDFYCERLQLPA